MEGCGKEREMIKTIKDTTKITGKFTDIRVEFACTAKSLLEVYEKAYGEEAKKQLREDFEIALMSEEELAKAVADKILEAIAGGAFKTEGNE